MGSLMHAVLRLAGLSFAAGAIAVSGRIGVFFAFGLIALAFALIAVLALTGTFGAEGSREAAQTVLAILLGRNQPDAAGSPRSKPATRSTPARSRAGGRPGPPGTRP